jgi:tetratricopeptide (TPR) repeat protein
MFVGLAVSLTLGFASSPGRTAVEVDEPAAVATIDRARDLLRMGATAEAADVFASILAEEPENDAAIEGRVLALIRLDRWTEALAEARKAHSRLPHSPRVASAYAEALFRAGRLWEAEPIVEPLADRPHPPHRALLTLARLRAVSGRSMEAAELIERALTDSPDDPDVFYWGAEVAGSRLAASRRLERFVDLAKGADADRLDAARSTLLLFDQLRERPVWVPVRRPATVEVPLALIRDTAGQPLGYAVRIRLGEKKRPVRVLLDSGSPGLFLTERIARRRGFEELAESTAFGGGGDGRHRSNRGLIPIMTLGGLEWGDILVTTTTDELEPHGRYHGLLGISIFQDSRVTLDLKHRRLIVETSDPSAEGSRYWYCSGQMLVRGASRDGHDGLFMFDTGAAWSILSTTFIDGIESARVDGKAEVRGFGGKVAGARFVRGVELEFQQLQTGPDPLRAIDLSLRSRLSGVEVSGYLGLDLLEDARIVIDTGARRVQVEKP